LSIGQNGSDVKVIFYYVCGQLGEYVSYHTQSSMKALYDMLMKSWAISGSGGPTIYSMHSTGGMGCNYKFSNLFIGVWCVIKYGHHSTHQNPNYSPY
jgi:hypothetical protein